MSLIRLETPAERAEAEDPLVMVLSKVHVIL